MSLKPIEKKNRVSDIKTGTHLAMIADMSLLKNDRGEKILIDGHPACVVKFKDGKNQVHEQTYVWDNGPRQKYFTSMLMAAQVEFPADGSSPSKKAALNKRLWISIHEVHYVNDDKVVMDGDVPKIEYYIFKVYPFIPDATTQGRPKIKGDPELNNGIASDEFITYKNIANGFGVNLPQSMSQPASKPEKEYKTQQTAKEWNMDGNGNVQFVQPADVSAKQQTAIPVSHTGGPVFAAPTFATPAPPAPTTQPAIQQPQAQAAPATTEPVLPAPGPTDDIMNQVPKFDF